MDKELLLKLFKIPAPTRKETAISGFIETYLSQNGIIYEKDKIGNIYNIGYKNKPLLSAHMDTVQGDDDTKLVDFIKIRGDCLSGYGVIGGDDKCGIYIILELLKTRKFNFIFSVQEENGGIGITNFVRDNYLGDILYCLVLDRRGSSDIICYNNRYGTLNFQNKLVSIGREFGYLTNTGIFSDANILSTKLSCANLSVGYHNPHTTNEFVFLSELENAKEYVITIIDEVKIKFEKPKSYDYDYCCNYDSYDYDSCCDDFDELDLFDRKYSCVFCRTYNNTFYLETLEKCICKSCAEKFFRDLAPEDLIDRESEEDNIKLFDDYIL